MHIGRVKLSVDLPGLDLSQRDLLLDIVEHHKEIFAFLGVAGVTVGHCDYRAVVFHDDGG